MRLLIISFLLLLGLKGLGQENEIRLALRIEINKREVALDSVSFKVELKLNDNISTFLKKESNNIIIEQFNDSLNLEFEYKDNLFWKQKFSFTQLFNLSGFNIEIENDYVDDKFNSKIIYHVSEIIKGHGSGRYWEVRKVKKHTKKKQK